MRRIDKRIYSAILIGALAVSLGASAISVEPAFATSAEQIRDQAKEELKNANNQIKDIETVQKEVATDLKKAAAEMNTLVANMEKVKGDIENKQNDVERASLELSNAKEAEAKQYVSMKLRIQYMYENSAQSSLWTAILESDGLGEMLNRLEYVSDLYQSDRDLMESYQQAVQAVEDWSVQLAQDMEQLLALQSDYEK